MSIQDNFAPLLRDCAQLMAAGENTDKRTVRTSTPQMTPPIGTFHPVVLERGKTFIEMFREQLPPWLKCINAEALTAPNTAAMLLWQHCCQDVMKSTARLLLPVSEDMWGSNNYCTAAGGDSG